MLPKININGSRAPAQAVATIYSKDQKKVPEDEGNDALT